MIVVMIITADVLIAEKGLYLLSNITNQGINDWYKGSLLRAFFINIEHSIKGEICAPLFTLEARFMKHCKSIPLILCAVCVISGYSQEWEKITPKFNPSGSYNMSLGTFVDKNTGWFTETFPGRTWRTQDGGLTWEMQIDSNAVWSNHIEFIDSTILLPL